MAKINFEDDSHFFINGDRFFVLYRHSTGADHTLLKREYFDVRKTSVGIQIKINKKSGYVGIALPIENKLLIGNEIFPVNSYNGHHYLYNKKQFNGSYTFENEDKTEISAPIAHSIVDEESCISVSPTTREEVIITPYVESFSDYVRIETYAPHGADFVSFFFDTSANYHLNLRRVSDRIKKKKKLDNLTTIFEYQEFFFNNQKKRKSLVNKKSKADALSIYKFIDKSLEVSPFFAGNASFYFEDLYEEFPSNSKIVVTTDSNLGYSKSKAKIIDKVNKMDSYRFNEYEGRKKQMEIESDRNNTVKIIFSENRKNIDQYLIEKENIKYLDLSGVLNLKLLNFQSSRNEDASLKKKKIDMQKISKIAHIKRKDDELERYGLFDLISGYTNCKFEDYFQDYESKFSFKELERLNNKYLKGATRAYVDISINRPFFVSCFETGKFYLFPVVNSELERRDARIILGNRFDDMEWLSLSKNHDENMDVDHFMKHRELYIDNVIYGGLLKVRKN